MSGLKYAAKRGQELLFHWTTAGIILAITGLPPEHWLSELSTDPPSWAVSQSTRTGLAAVGLAIIVWDRLLRPKRNALLPTEAKVTSEQDVEAVNSQIRTDKKKEPWVIKPTGEDGVSEVEGTVIMDDTKVPVRLPRFR